MESVPSTLIALGGLLFFGLLSEFIGKFVHIPRVTLLLLAGFAIGPNAFDLLSHSITDQYKLITEVTLVMVGFLLGGQFTKKQFKRFGRMIIGLSAYEVLLTFVVVSGGLWAIGIDPKLALLLGALSTATDPAATADVIREIRAKGPMTQTLLGIVAIDDAMGLLLFSLTLTLVEMLSGGGAVYGPLMTGLWELGVSFLVGLVLGFPMAFLTGRLKPGEPTLLEAIGMVLLCTGVSLWLEVNFLIAAMTMGMVVVNFAKHHTRALHAIENIHWPFLILFFLLAGASLEISSLIAVSWVGGFYIGFRILGRLISGGVGGWLMGADKNVTQWLGLALMPQAGVALGMALMVVHHFPEYKNQLLPIIIGSTVIFELIGPIMTRLALFKAGEVQSKTEG